MNDDLYPNDSSYFLPQEPKEQRIARSKERAKTLEFVGVLEDLIKRLDNRIKFYENISSIPENVRAEPDKFLIMHNSHTMTAKNLKDEKEWMTALLDTHAPNR